MGAIRTLVTVLKLNADQAFKGLKAYDKAWKMIDATAEKVASNIEKSADRAAKAFESMGRAAANIPRVSGAGGSGGGVPRSPSGYGGKVKTGQGRGHSEISNLNAKDLQGAPKVLKDIGDSAQTASKGLGSMSVAVGNLVASGLSTVITGAKDAFVGAVKSAIEFESAMADISKVIDGLKTPTGEITEEYKKMEQTIFNLSKEIAVAPEGFAKIIAAAGQSGIAKEDLEQFAESAAKVSVAFGITAEEAGNAMAKLRTGLGLSQDEVEALQGTFNVLDNNMAVTAAEAQEVVMRIGSIGKAAGVSGQEIAGLGAAMIASGNATEVSATAAKNYYLALTSGDTATKRQRAAFKRLGFDAEDVAKRFAASGESRLQVQRELLTSISKLDQAQRTSTLSNLFGKESLGAIASVATDIGKFNSAMELALDTTKAATSVQDEYNVRSKTTENSLQLLKNSATIFAIQLGEKVLPTIVKVAEWLSSPEVGEYGQMALDGLSTAAQLFYEKLTRAWEVAGPFVTAIGEGLVTAFQTAWPLIVQVATAVQEFGATVWEALGLAGEGGKAFGDGLGETLLNTVVGGLNAVIAAVNIVTEVVGFLGDKFGWLIDILKGSLLASFDLVASTLDGIATIVNGLIDGFKMLASGNITGGLIKLGNALIDGLLAPLKAIIRQVINLADTIPGGGSIVPDAVRKFANGSIVDRAIESATKARQNYKEAAPEEVDLGPSRGASQPKTKKPQPQGFVPGDEGEGSSGGGGGGSSRSSGAKKKKGKEKFASDSMSHDEQMARFKELEAKGKTRKPSEDREYNRLSKTLDERKAGKLSKEEKALANLDPSLSGVLAGEDGKVHDDILSKGAFKAATNPHGTATDRGSSSAGPNITNIYNNQTVSTIVNQTIDARGSSSAEDNIRSSGQAAGTAAGGVIFKGVASVMALRNGGGVMRGA